MKIKLFAASLVLVFIFTLVLSLAVTQTASAINKECNCALIYCIDPPYDVMRYGKLHEGERPECQPNPSECDVIPCD